MPPKLTEVKIRAARPGEKNRRMSDERGLYLEITPAGGKLWRFKYYFGGVEKRLALGKYPEITLREARDRREEARKLLAHGVDPSEHRKKLKMATKAAAENKFETIAREWHQKNSDTWVASHRDLVLRRLKNDIFPWLGQQAIDGIDPPELLEVLRRVEARGAIETAHRELQVIGQIFRFAVATGRCDRDITADLKGALSPAQNNHLAAVTEPKRFGEILQMIDGYQGGIVVRCALRLAPLVFVRPGELRFAQWTDIDFEQAEWRFVVTKTRTPHIVPLSRQALAIFKEIQPVTGHKQYVFSNPRSPLKPMSENAVLAALRYLGINKEEMSGHGFRASARTMLDEVLKFPPHLIEHQLAHIVKDPLGRSYNRTQHLEERREMMQGWADFLDRLKGGAIR
jgi:integrase